MDKSNLDKLTLAFSTGLGMAANDVSDSLAYGNPGWDSVAHMALVAEIERTFDIMLDTDDVIALSSFSVAKQILGKYGVTIEA